MVGSSVGNDIHTAIGSPQRQLDQHQLSSITALPGQGRGVYRTDWLRQHL